MKNQTPSRKVKRSLFGRPDQAEVDKFLDENLGQMRREKAAEIKQKLGFDVITEKPISNSNIEWEKVRNPPSFYETTNGKRKGRTELNRVDLEKTKEQKCKNHVIAVQPISDPEPTCKPKTLSVLKFRPGNLAGRKRTLRSAVPSHSQLEITQTTLRFEVQGRRSPAKKSKLTCASQFR